MNWSLSEVRKYRWKVLFGLGAASILVAAMRCSKRTLAKFQALQQEVFLPLLLLGSSKDSNSTNYIIDEQTENEDEMHILASKVQEWADRMAIKGWRRYKHFLFCGFPIELLAGQLASTRLQLGGGQKEEIFDQLKILIFARGISTLYLLVLRLFLYRITACILVRRKLIRAALKSREGALDINSETIMDETKNDEFEEFKKLWTSRFNQESSGMIQFDKMERCTSTYSILPKCNFAEGHAFLTVIDNLGNHPAVGLIVAACKAATNKIVGHIGPQQLVSLNNLQHFACSIAHIAHYSLLQSSLDDANIKILHIIDNNLNKPVHENINTKINDSARKQDDAVDYESTYLNGYDSSGVAYYNGSNIGNVSLEHLLLPDSAELDELCQVIPPESRKNVQSYFVDVKEILGLPEFLNVFLYLLDSCILKMMEIIGEVLSLPSHSLKEPIRGNYNIYSVSHLSSLPPSMSDSSFGILTASYLKQAVSQVPLYSSYNNCATSAPTVHPLCCCTSYSSSYTLSNDAPCSNIDHNNGTIRNMATGLTSNATVTNTSKTTVTTIGTQTTTATCSIAATPMSIPQQEKCKEDMLLPFAKYYGPISRITEKMFIYEKNEFFKVFIASEFVSDFCRMIYMPTEAFNSNSYSITKEQLSNSAITSSHKTYMQPCGIITASILNK